MKRRHTILAFLVILGSRPVVAQQPQRVVEPEYLNTFFRRSWGQVCEYVNSW